ncbi:hypothetical protein [Trinickia mobilis]|uniref:hypothetical protein n=1 Tax=Trinickia mobilis TaxID=2816356 RepID=UPI001A8E1F7E|nr:hypothetical protein [Trinickia mobilis]
MRDRPLFFGIPELLRMRDLTPEQAFRVELPIFAWPPLAWQAQSALVHMEVDYEPSHVGEHQLTAFLDDTLGSDWRRAPVRNEMVWRAMLDRLQREIEQGTWVKLASTKFGTGLVDWVDDLEMPDGGRWQVNRKGHNSSIGGALRWQLDYVYRQRSMRAGANQEKDGGAQVEREVAAAAWRVAPPMPKAPKPQTTVEVPELGQSANAILAKSPTLQRDLKELAAKKWELSYGQSGKGSFANRVSDDSDSPSQIVLDGIYKNDPRGAIQTLAHEVGHAKYTYAVDPTNKAACVNSFLSDEGAATIKNIEVQREILANGGPDIGIAGDPRNHSAYNRAYDSYLQSGNAKQARSDIGAILGNGEYTSNTRQTYGSYYGDWCENNAGK